MYIRCNRDFRPRLQQAVSMRSIIIGSLILISNAFGQSKWRPHAGINASMDAGGYFWGPSITAGTDYRLNDKVSASSYVQYFSARLNDSYPDGTIEKGKYNSLVVAALIQSNLSKNQNNGLRAGIGLAFQKSTTRSDINNLRDTTRRNILVAAFRLGYYILLDPQLIVIEFDAVGPHRSTEGTPPYQYEVTELLTQLSLGIKFVF